MSQPGSRPVNPAVAASINLRGAVDLSALKNARPPAPPAGGAGGAAGGQGGPGTAPAGQDAAGPASLPGGQDAGLAGGFVVDVTEQSFPELVQLSAQVPVIVSLGAPWSGQSAALNGILEGLVAEYAGRLLLARVDTETSPQIAQAFGAQAIPTVVAMIKGQPVPLFEGEMPQEQVRRFLEELLKVAAANGVDGMLGPQAGAEPAERPLPPLHQAAFDAIEAGDYAAAESAYLQALAEQPADADAKVGLAQVQLMQRTGDVSADQTEQLRRSAAEAPDDVDAQLAVADLDVVGGHVEDAFSRIVGYIAAHFGPERETARVRLLELFDVVGISDPRVAKARQSLARALF
jgi:putative thioredoxin